MTMILLKSLSAVRISIKLWGGGEGRVNPNSTRQSSMRYDVEVRKQTMCSFSSSDK